MNCYIRLEVEISFEKIKVIGIICVWGIMKYNWIIVESSDFEVGL